MNFCESFWSELRYDRLKIAAQVSRPGERGVTQEEFYRARHDMFRNPEAKNIDATSVSHEMGHLFWVGYEKIGNQVYSGGLNYPNGFDSCQHVDETYGLYSCALAAWNEGKPFAGDPHTSWNSEQYATYGEYVRFFDLLGKMDFWHPNRKPVKIPVQLKFD
ncbi:hypothetical protein NUU61_008424 [Penicillium alfredii]|uniref:Uncharacterized protein n=1 Tax=Penicillium alfredii TaxID=1506179 RepID=A0A9W9ESD2_9EURO|nr:uncharacterized protein NUU61_008424 [Penicillium alfredii]KAJ5087117.1 hypothetical protein NUU61_008424 [Penicillium alfredii]